MITEFLVRYFSSVAIHMQKAKEAGGDDGIYYLWANVWAHQSVFLALLFLFVLFSILVIFPLQVYNIILLSKIKTYIKKRGEK